MFDMISQLKKPELILKVLIDTILLCLIKKTGVLKSVKRCFTLL